ncbi:MAG TPA: hypothetical protein VIM76_10705 [Candidatus Dormibacteraeota bacterium]|jgi:hypothetical protein
MATDSHGAAAASRIVEFLWAGFTPTLVFGYAMAWMFASLLAG